jgi:transposase
MEAYKMGNRKKYDRNFKLDAIRLCKESGMNQRDFEKDMGIGAGCINRWKRQLLEEQDHAFPGNGTPRDQEIARLKKENTQLRQERDILKKAMGIFSKPPETGSGLS